jgi:hypothetical protein
MSPGGWLPPLVLLHDHQGDWDTYEDVLYGHFCDDFVARPPSFRGRRIGLKRFPLDKGKEATFWHLISEGQVEAERLPDMRRCERIRWPRPMIHNSESNSLRIWRQERRGEQRVAIALCDFTYVVILAERPGQNGIYHLPWTAFCVEQPHQRSKLEKEWQKFKL